MCIWIYYKYSSTSLKQRLWQRKTVLIWQNVCRCGAVVKEMFARADKPRSSPVNAVFCFFVPFSFFLFGFFFLTLFFLLAFFSLFLLLTLLVKHLDQYIYFKLESGVLFWLRDFKSSWSAYWPSLRPDKNHKLSRHVPPLKRLNFFQC